MIVITIGRLPDNDVVFEKDETVSKHHCQIVKHDDGRYTFIDLNSKNGTFINGKLRKEGELKTTDFVRVGNSLVKWLKYFNDQNLILLNQERPINYKESEDYKKNEEDKQIANNETYQEENEKEEVIEQRNHNIQTVKPKIGYVKPTIIDYAGFGARFLAQLVDNIIVNVIVFALFMIFSNILYFSEFEYIIILFTVHTIVNWLYFALQESSKSGATLGKKLCRIKVINQNLQQISFGTATGRYLGKLLSSFIFGIGYLIPLFRKNDNKALHDIIANTTVVNY